MIKPNYLAILPPTQYHSFFRNLPPFVICHFVSHDLAWLYDLIRMSISPDFGSKLLCLAAPAESLFTNLSCRRVLHNSSSCPGLRTESAVQMLSLAFHRWYFCCVFKISCQDVFKVDRMGEILPPDKLLMVLFSSCLLCCCSSTSLDQILISSCGIFCWDDCDDDETISCSALDVTRAP